MKKEIVIISILLVSLILLPLTLAATQEERQNLRQCLTNCTEQQKSSKTQCTQDYRACNSACTTVSCMRSCKVTRNDCIKETATDAKSCKKECALNAQPSLCLNGTVKVGQTFTQGCDVCTCKSNAKIDCKQDNFCNLNVTVPQTTCTNAGGFHHRLCTGPYFSVICSQDSYCMCDGTNKYTCPSEYTCLKNFTAPIKRKASIPDWRNLLGQSLGPIGICGLPSINNSST